MRKAEDNKIYMEGLTQAFLQGRGNGLSRE
jgi:hypothetical protein